MTRIINVLNQKGGVGKTQTTTNLAVGLANQGFKVCIIDADSQGNTTSYFAPDIKSLDLKKLNKELSIVQSSNYLSTLEHLLGKSMYEYDLSSILLAEVENVKDAVYSTNVENLSIIPSTCTKLISTDQKIKLSNGMVHTRLLRALEIIKSDFDYIIIDNAPTFNTITLNTLFSSNEVLIPIKIGRFELEGFIATMKELTTMMLDYECRFDMKVLIQMLPRGNRPDYEEFIFKFGELVNNANQFYNIELLTTTIGFQDAVASKSSITNQFLIDTNSNVANDYINLVKELSNVAK